MNHGPRIAAMLTRLNWTQPEMARFLGLRQPSVSRLVNGQVESGPVEKLLDALATERGFDDLTSARFTWNKSETKPPEVVVR